MEIAGWESSVMNYAACRIFNLVAENNLAYTWSNCKLSSDLEGKKIKDLMVTLQLMREDKELSDYKGEKKSNPKVTTVIRRKS